MAKKSDGSLSSKVLVGRSPSWARRGAPNVTLKDVARLAGVSAQTVSCVVNNRGSVSDEVRVRVGEIAVRMGYFPNKSAKAMRTGRSGMFGLVIPDMNSPFFPELAQSVEHAAADAGYAILLVDGHGSLDKAADRIAALPSHPVDGVIATEYSAAVGKLGLPTVLIGGPVKGLDCVNADDSAGGDIVAEYLLGKGHRSFGLVTGTHSTCLPLRRDAFLEAISGRGRVPWEIYTSDDETLTSEANEYLARTDMTAIVCSNDVIAIHVLKALRALGRQVPRDLSVVGFDDIPWASIVTPGLTTVRQPYELLGSRAVELLCKRIEARERRTSKLRFPVHLIERESVAATIDVDLNQGDQTRGAPPSRKRAEPSIA